MCLKFSILRNVTEKIPKRAGSKLPSKDYRLLFRNHNAKTLFSSPFAIFNPFSNLSIKASCFPHWDTQ